MMRNKIYTMVIRQFTPKQGNYKFLTTFNPETFEIHEFPVDSDSEVRTYDILLLYYSSRNHTEWNFVWGTHKIDKETIKRLTDRDDLPNRYKTYENYWEVVSHRKVKQNIMVDFNDVTFYDRFLTTREGIKITEEMFSKDQVFFAPSFNKLQPINGSLNIIGYAEVIRRKVHDIWKDVPRMSTLSKVVIKNYDLKDMEKIISDHKEDIEYKELLAFVKSKWKNGILLTAHELQTRFPGKFKNISPNDLLSQIAMKKNWNKAFFDIIKKISNGVYFYEDFFLFGVGDFWVIEVPEAGNATYIFDDTLIPLALCDRFINTSKKLILSDKDIQKALGFIKRVIHPKNMDFVERWFKEITKATKRNYANLDYNPN